MAVDREQISAYKRAYMTLFDQIADPDGSNYPRLRHLVWGAIEGRAGTLNKQQQSQALSMLTYTLLVTAVACAAAAALPVGSAVDERQIRLDRAGWCLGLIYALSMTHPESVAGETPLDLLGVEALTDLCSTATPPVSDANFWGEFRVVGEALYGRLFTLAPPQIEQTDRLLYALGTGMGLCSRAEIRFRLLFVREMVSKVFSAAGA